MSSGTTQTHSSNKRGRGRGGRRNSKASQGPGKMPALTNGATLPEAPAQANKDDTKDVCESSTAVCFICAEPVKYYALSACNHRTCHVCTLRLRALYKRLDCTLCKEPQSIVIFTSSPDAVFSSYTLARMRHKDAKLSIYFETEEMMEETLVLLRFNCPDQDCAYTASGWGDLKLHVRATHAKLLCDLCLRTKKVFAHEHVLYPHNILPLHLPSMSHRPHKHDPKDPIEGGVHPLCEFCRECFFSDDELFVHMRDKHEECFICKRNELRDQYFQNYDSLENHFSRVHFTCDSPMCRAQKFVVFASLIDLQAHRVEVHGDEMSTRDRRAARQVPAGFSFEDPLRRNRPLREREPPPERNTSPPRVGSSLRDLFGGRFAGEPSSAPAPGTRSASSTRLTSVATREDIDSAVLGRHASCLNRLEAIAPNATTAVPAVRAAIRGYCANESTAKDIISTVWIILDHDLDNTASIINGIVDTLDEDEKKSALLSAWNSFRIEQRQQFPELVPTSSGSAYAGIASGRIISTKNATTRHSRKSTRKNWASLAQPAAGSSSSSSTHVVPGADPHSRPGTHTPPVADERFPPLPRTWKSLASESRRAQGQRSTPPLDGPMSVSSSSVSVVSTPREVPSVLRSTAFPELPSAAPRARPFIGGNQSLRNIIGESGTNSWAQLALLQATGGSGAVDESSGPVALIAGAADGYTVEDGGGKGKKGKGKGNKGKGKQKQTVLSLGSFPG